MGSINWEKFGEEISKTVQEAVETKNFDKLNQMITEKVNQAADTVTQSVKNVVHVSKASHEEHTSYSSYKTYTTDKERMKRTETQNGRTSGMQYSNVRRESTALSVVPSKIPSKIGTILSAVAGYTFGAFQCIIFIVFLSFIGFSGFAPEVLIAAMMMVIFSGALGAGGLGLGIIQTKKLGRIERFKTYLSALGQREYCNISEIAEKSGQSAKIVLKDLEYMIRKKWFLQGHLDNRKSCLMVTDKMYSQYCQLEQQKAIQQKDAKEREAQQKKQQEEKIAAGKMLPPEVQKVIELGDEYVKKIRACNDDIPGEEISAKIYRIEMLVDKIFDRVEQNPKSVSDIQKLMDYYLPTTVKLLEAYAQMDAQPAGGENIQSAKSEIEATLDTLNVAFEKLLDSLFQETAWDVSSDISVLNTMLAQEGLKEDGLKRK